MKKILISLMFMLVGFMAMARALPLFLFIDMDEDGLAHQILLEELNSQLLESEQFVSGRLDNPETIELLIRGMAIYYNKIHIGYAISMAVVFHDSTRVNKSDVTVLTCNANREGLIWAAGSMYNYFKNLVDTTYSTTTNWR